MTNFFSYLFLLSVLISNAQDAKQKIKICDFSIFDFHKESVDLKKIKIIKYELCGSKSDSVKDDLEIIHTRNIDSLSSINIKVLNDSLKIIHIFNDIEFKSSYFNVYDQLVINGNSFYINKLLKNKHTFRPWINEVYQFRSSNFNYLIFKILDYEKKNYLCDFLLFRLDNNKVYPISFPKYVKIVNTKDLALGDINLDGNPDLLIYKKGTLMFYSIIQNKFKLKINDKFIFNLNNYVQSSGIQFSILKKDFISKIKTKECLDDFHWGDL